jgi:PAS domain S-box-containing protein
MGRRIWELGFLKDVFASEDNFIELQRKGYVRYDDLPLKANDGRRIDVEFVSNVYLVNEQRVVQCNIRDISQRARAEAALRASESKYHGLFEATRDALMTLGPPDWRFRSGNPAAIRMFGASTAEELVSHSPWEASPERQPDGRFSSEKAMEMIQQALREGSHSFEWTHRRVGGEEFAADVLLTRVPEGDDAILYATIRDVTENKRAEEALEASLREKKALLREVHHRVKNNLQVITSLLRLEAGRRADAGTRLVLREMQGRILSMALLHETLYRTGDFGRVDLANYLKQLTEQFFRAQSPGPGVVRVEMELGPAHVGIDQAIPCGLIVNELLTNSLKHGFPSGKGGEVRVVIRSEEEGPIYLAVSDNGAGLPPDFEVRQEKSLGLQLVSDLARQIGGRLDIGPAPLAAFAITFTPTPPHSTGPTQRPPAGPEASPIAHSGRC